ncbi:MAG: tyrosine-type recombinase/integrase [Acidimicrobiales bacterium]
MPRRDGGIERRAGASGEVAWRARWYDTAGRRQSATFSTKAEADAWLAERVVEVHRGGTGSMEGRRLTLAEWWAKWQSGRQVSLLAARREQSAWDCWVGPHLGQARLADLRRSGVQAWVAGQARAGLAPRTVARHLGVLRACLSAAVADGLIAANPASKVQVPRAPKAEQRFLSTDEVRRLAEAVQPAYRSIVALGVACGLRIGELVALQVGVLRITSTCTEPITEFVQV